MEGSKDRKALIAMSGGVDSSVAALLMQEAGYTCVGATMRLYEKKGSLQEKKEAEAVCPACGCRTGCEMEKPEAKGACGSGDDAEDAKKVADRLGIPHYVLDLTGPFREEVMERFVCAYESGSTPNPCMDCNRHLKFGLLLKQAREMGCETLATGHYAQICRDETTGRYLLKKAADPAKDQSYVLSRMTQEELAHTVFPLGKYSKPQIRQLAQEHGFINARKADSQDICFVPDGDYAAFLERFTGKQYPHGDFVDLEGHVLGEHKGQVRYTIGQRRGLGIAYKEPLYVIGKDLEKNTVILGPDSALFTGALTASDVNWIMERPAEPMRVQAKIRYRHIPCGAVVTPVGEDRIQVVFDSPQRAVTAGQAVVLYDGDTVVCGGTIDRNGPAF